MTSYFVPSPITAAQAANLDATVSSRMTSAQQNISVAQAANLDAAVSSRATRPAAATFFQTSVGAPAGNALVADSGPLAAGEYELEVSAYDTITAAGAGSDSRVQLQHRDAANAANIRALTIVRDSGAGPQGSFVMWPRFTVAVNERIRVINIDAVAFNGQTSISVFLRTV